MNAYRTATRASRKAFFRMNAVALVVVLLGTVSLRAEEKAKARSERPKSAVKIERTVNKKSRDTRVIVTGSHIRQNVRRVGKSLDVASPVIVIDRREVERSGASDVGDLLRRMPFLW